MVGWVGWSAYLALKITASLGGWVFGGKKLANFCAKRPKRMILLWDLGLPPFDSLLLLLGDPSAVKLRQEKIVSQERLELSELRPGGDTWCVLTGGEASGGYPPSEEGGGRGKMHWPQL